ncbi:DoxX family protein [Paenibacillus flagellatus]|uniref:DoxX-like family protein n=1 Tax=Paenibacillus flagellatus TaxID=2211139 RepID=A0A2V5JYH9_9BACL|nr:DoxX family protein [Paenibacillus flagellatus]PYI51761.1 DoxX-like family protein [Paenibacillus flagellatus]
MKKTNVSYWCFTGLLSILMGVGSIPDILAVPDAVALFERLGYPVYLLPFLGIAKLLGIAAILVPGFARVKEWAYAGLTFDLLGAMYSSIASGDPVLGSLPFLVGFALIAGSYTLSHKRRRDRSAATVEAQEPRLQTA